MKYKLFEPALVLTVFVLDRLAKFFTLKHLYCQSVEVLPFFRLTYVQNTGVAFGMSLTQIGPVGGPPLFGFIVDTSGSYRVAWFCMAAFCVASALVAAVGIRDIRKNKRKNKEQKYLSHENFLLCMSARKIKIID